MLTASDLARLCDQYVSALWRGETDEVHRFGVWLRAHWALGPDEPPGAPAAFSSVGGGGAGIRWHRRDGMLLGYIPDVLDRCYQVSVEETPPSLRPAVRSGTDGSAPKDGARALNSERDPSLRSG